MRRKDLARLVDKVGDFSRPKLRLEQYATPGDLVATVVWDAYMRGEVVGRKVIDLGCGTGRFSLAVATLGGYSICLDVDLDAVKDAERYVRSPNVDYVVCDALMPCVRRADLVVMNPPFGIWCAHSDVEFLRSASSLGRVVYSIHKASSKEFVEEFARRLGLRVSEIETAWLPIPLQYGHHRKRVHKVAVVILRFETRK